jgi:hypothetical protein
MHVSRGLRRHFCKKVHVAAELPTMNQPLLIDDFSRADGRSALGTRWQGLSDQVMGGLSEMQTGFREEDGGRMMNLRGRVRLENRGGFIQVRLPLDPEDRPFDASPWSGIRIRVRGRPGPYYLHLRTRHNWMPWQHYRAPLEVGTDWADQFVPFTAFEGKATMRGLDVSGLKSLAVVAYGAAFDADIDVARIEFAR